MNYLTKKKSNKEIQNKNEINLGIFGKYDILKINLSFFSIILGLFSSFNFANFVFVLSIISIFLIIKDKSKNYFLFAVFVVSYIFSYFLYIKSILNVFLHADYIWIINIIVGLIFIYCFFMKTYYNNEVNIENDSNSLQKDKIRIDIPLLLLFFVVFLGFLLSSINFVNHNSELSKFLFYISFSNEMVIFDYFYILLYLIFSLIFMSFILFLSIIFINKFFYKNFKNIENILLCLVGFLFLFL